MSYWKAIGVLALLIVGGYFAFEKLQTATPVDVVVAGKGDIRTFVEERAKTRLPHVYRITMPGDGRIMPISLVEGDSVAQGQLVAEMDQADLQTVVAESKARVEKLAAQIVENDDVRLENNALIQFDSFLESMVRTVESAEAQTRSSRANFEFSDSELKRKRPLAKTNAISDSELEEAELKKFESEIDFQKDVLTWRAIQAIHSGMLVGRESIEKYIEKKSLQRAVLLKEKAEAEARLEKSQRDMARGRMLSPVDGVVLKREVSNQRVIPVGQLLLEIGRLEDLEIEAEVLSQEVVDVNVGAAVEIYGPAIGKIPATGTVKRIYPQGFTKVSSLGVEQQRVLVIIGFDDEGLQRLKSAQRRLGADYRVRVKIFTDSRSDVLKVPLSAVFRAPDGGRRVFTVRDGIAHLIPVEVGLINDAEVEILEGIQAGEQVILTPETSLEDGTAVDATVRKRE